MFTCSLHAEYVCGRSEQCNACFKLPELEQSGAEASKILQMLCSQPSRECWRCCKCTIQALLTYCPIFACLYNSKQGWRQRRLLGGSHSIAFEEEFKSSLKG